MQGQVRIGRALFVASLACGTAANLGLWFGYEHWQFALWLLSLALLVPAFPGRRAEPRGVSEPWSVNEIVLFALIVLLGAFFRLYRLDSIPPGLWVDEINAAQRAEQLMLSKPFQPFGATPLTWLENWVQTSNLYLYSIVLLFRTVGFGYWPIKMISVIPGILGVPALYLFARELAGKRTAAVAGVLFAVGHWNARLSRWGWDEVAMTTLQIVSFYFLVHGFRRRRTRSFVWAGIFMGLCLNTYIASRLALAAALACLGLYVVSRRGGWRERAKPLAVFVLATAITVGPLAIFYLQHPHFFSVRTAEVNLLSRALKDDNFQPLIANVVAHLKMFHVRGDVFAKHDLPYAPMLDPVTGALFVLGLAMSLWRWRSPGFLLCQCWLWFGLLAGMLSDNFGHPHAYRTGNVAPAAIVMAALPLGWVLDRFSEARGASALRRRVAVGFAAVAVVAAVVLNGENLLRWMRVPELWGETMGSPGTNLARHILRRHPGEPVFVSRGVTDGAFGALMSSGLDDAGSLFENWNPDYWNPDTNPPLGDLAHDATFYCSPAWESWIRGWYPNTEWSELRNVFGDVYCAVAVIPLADIRATHGFRRIIVNAGSEESVSDIPFAPRALEGLDGTWTLFSGYEHERGPGYVTFAVPSGFSGTLWLDGRRLLGAGETVSRPARVTFGLHSLLVLLPGTEQRPPRLAKRNEWMRGVEIPIEKLSTEEGSRGLRATFYDGIEWQGEPLSVLEAALPSVVPNHPTPPYSVVWQGDLRADDEGDYVIGAAMDDGGSLRIDGQSLFEAGVGYTDAEVWLSRGRHRIEVRYYDKGEGAYLSLRWIPPGHRESVPEEQWASRRFVPLEADDVYRLPFAGSGLRARYYANTEFEGDPFLSVVEAGRWLEHHQGEHFSVELDGSWYFPHDGRYWLGLDSDDGSWLYIDGELIVDNGGVHGFAPKGREVEVSQGLHHVRVRYFQLIGGAGLKLLWAEEGKEPNPVLPVFLYPAEERGGATASP